MFNTDRDEARRKFAFWITVAALFAWALFSM